MPRRLNVFCRNAAEAFARRAIAALGDEIHSIVLYDSVARKQAKRESDIDTLVVGTEPAMQDKVSDIAYQGSQGSGFEAFVTLIYFSQEEFQRLVGIGSSFLAYVMDDGVILHDDGTIRSAREQLPASR